MEHKKKIIPLCMIALSAFAFISCNQNPKTSDIELELTQETAAAARSILPQSTPLNIEQYTVECTGPTADDHITIETSKTKVQLKGLKIGRWTITATGKNENGLSIIQGTKAVQLGNDPIIARIELDTLVGRGDVQIDFNWDASCVKSPALVLQKKYQDGNEETIEPTAFDGTGGTAQYRATWNAGSYTVTATLKDNDISVAGGVEAIRIVQSKTSNGAIDFNLDKLPTQDSSLQLIDKSGVPLSYSIEGIEDSVLFGQTITASLSSELGYPIPTDSTTNWYLDGKYTTSGTTCSLTPKLGKHRLDAVVERPALGASASTTKTFITTLDTPLQTPQVIETFDQSNSNLKLGGHETVTFLPDNRFLVYSGSNKTLQLCRFVGNTLDVIKTFSNSSALPLGKVTDMLYFDSLSLLAISETTTNTLYVYQFANDNLVLKYKHLLSYSYNGKVYTCGAGDLAYNGDEGIWVIGYGANYLMKFSLDATDQDEFNSTLQLVCHTYKTCKDGGPLQGASSPLGHSVATVSDTYFTMDIDVNGDLRLTQLAAPVAYPDFSALCTLPISNTSAFVGTADGIDVLVKTSTSPLAVSIKHSYTSNNEGIPKLGKVIHLDWAPDTTGSDPKYLYALSNESNAIHCFAIEDDDLDDLEAPTLNYIATTELGDFCPSDLSFSYTHDLMILTSEDDAKIVICRMNR